MAMGKSSPPIPAPQPQVVVPQSEDSSVKQAEQEAAKRAADREGVSAHLLSRDGTGTGFGTSLGNTDPETQRKRLLAGSTAIG